MRRWLDRGVSLYEYFIVYVFLQGGYDVWDAKVVITEFGLVNPLTTRQAIIVYAVMFVTLGLALLATKLFHRPKLRGIVLQVMYVVAFYIVCLSLIVNGWAAGIIFPVFITLSIAATYIYWRYRFLFGTLNKEG